MNQPQRFHISIKSIFLATLLVAAYLGGISYQKRRSEELTRSAAKQISRDRRLIKALVRKNADLNHTRLQYEKALNQRPGTQP